MRTLAIIPARGGSKRIVQKNIRPFLGTPLVQWSILFAKTIDQFDRVIVSTDNSEIAEISRAAGGDVPYLRPTDLASDTASSTDVVLDALQREEARGEYYDCVALLQPTSPMRLSSRWQSAFQMIADMGCDAVVGVAPARDHPYHVFNWNADGKLAPFTEAAGLRLRSQDLPAAVVLAGNLYLVRTEVLQREATFFPTRTAGVLCDQPYETVDIDTESDWIAAEALGRYYDQKPDGDR